MTLTRDSTELDQPKDGVIEMRRQVSLGILCNNKTRTTFRQTPNACRVTTTQCQVPYPCKAVAVQPYSKITTPFCPRNLESIVTRMPDATKHNTLASFAIPRSIAIAFLAHPPHIFRCRTNPALLRARITPYCHAITCSTSTNRGIIPSNSK